MSRKHSGAAELASLTAAVTANLDVERPRPARSVPAPNQMMAVTHAVRDAREEASKLKASQGRALVVALDLCDDGPHHATPIDDTRVEELRSNLAENGQSTPAVVRPKPEGRFEIVSGRHRKRALQSLGKTSWEVVIKDMDDDTAERLTFYDNLLAPHYSDYDKYLGFSARRNSKSLTIEQLAAESGASVATVGRLLAFGRLPGPALELIKVKPKVIGASLAQAMAGLAEKHEERVVQAVQLVLDGKLSAAAAPAWVVEKKRAVSKPTETVIKQGKSTFAKLAYRQDQITIRFSNPNDAKALQAGIEELVKRHATAKQ